MSDESGLELGEPPSDGWALPMDAPTAQWRARRRLAAAVRKLNEETVVLDDTEAMESLASGLESLLAQTRDVPRQTYTDALAVLGFNAPRAHWVDRIAVVGRSNPLAPPLMLSRSGEQAMGRVTYNDAFQGPPGHVHGGHVAAGFDQVCGYVQVMRGVTCMTGSLEVRYRRPTPLGIPLVYEAELAGIEGRTHRVQGRLRIDGDDGTVLATAEGRFVELSLEALVEKLGGV